MKLVCIGFAFLIFLMFSAPSARAWNEHYTALQRHMERVTANRTEQAFAGLKSPKDWRDRRATIKARLEHVMGYDREWPEEPPQVQITNTITRPEFTVECVVAETAPGIYVTANLYLPVDGEKPCPVIIYQSGHWPNSPWGHKTLFKTHAAWFASRGIAMLIMDSIEMGELRVTHHGLIQYRWYDLISRGYSPLAVEVFNARRMIDYLVTRGDIDPARIGATGISGGGVTTFFLTAADERVAAGAPVSGVCSSFGQIEGRLSWMHCDCMYLMNSYGLTYAEIGALTAPRHMLLCNAESDIMFPMTYFNQLVGEMSKVYRLLGAGEKIGTATVPGRHADSEEIRLPVYEFYMRLFMGKDLNLTQHGAVDTSFTDEQLLCMRSGFPLDERLTGIHKEFMPRAALIPQQLNQSGREVRLEELASLLRERVFGYFPQDDHAPTPEWGEEFNLWGRRVRKVSYEGWDGIRINGWYSLPGHIDNETKLPAVLVINKGHSFSYVPPLRPEGYDWGDRAVLAVELLDSGTRAIDDSLAHQMKRQALIIGRSFDGMRVYELLRSLQLLRSMHSVDASNVTVAGKGVLGIDGLYSALLSPGPPVKSVVDSPTASHIEGPYFLGILRETDIPEVISLLRPRVRVIGEIPTEIESYMQQTDPGEKWHFSNLAEALQ